MQHALSGKIKCGLCGANFVARQKRCSNGTTILRWSCSTVVRGGTCEVGRLLRDDDARHMLHQALGALNIDWNEIGEALLAMIQEVGEGKGKRHQEMWQSLQRKKEAVMDAYFSGDITVQDMQCMKERYQRQQDQLDYDRVEDVQPWGNRGQEMKQVLDALLQGRLSSDALCRMLIQEIVVYPDRHVELTIRGLPHVFMFSE